jgi:hypothetical protein
MIWQALGLLVVIAEALEIRSATQQFTWTFYHGKSVGIIDPGWPIALGVFAGFLPLAGTTAMISGYVLSNILAGPAWRRRYSCSSIHIAPSIGFGR